MLPQDQTDIDAVNAALNDLSNTFFQNGPAFYSAYIRQRFNVSPSPVTAQKYAGLLLDSPWRALRQIEQNQGTWNNASLEMFEHFLKYQICGATDNDINNVYVQLTTTEPKLNAGGFADISPPTWKNYRGWVASGAFDGPMVPLQNVDAKGFIIFPVPPSRFPSSRVIETSAADSYIGHAGFRKPENSGSCFSGNALVVMSDGSLKRIDQILSGDVVLSSGPGKPAISRTVAFVSTPNRGQRSLYSIDG